MNARLIAAVLVLAGCQTREPAQGSVVKGGPGSSSAGLAAGDTLDRLDTRVPLPLLPVMALHQKANMRDHLTVVQEVVSALGVGDFARVAEAAKRMGYSEGMAQMCRHMGAAAPGFSERALDFHRAADRVAEAAGKQDSAAVLAAMAETLDRCTTCHRTYKQKLVDTLPP